jgi:hypothetical protein
MAFTACLAGVADDAASPIRVVVSIRSDFLDRVAEDQRFMTDLSQGLFFLTPPNRDGLRDALVQPAEMAGYQFETPMMVDNMLEHLEATQGALPLLQFAAAKLWENRDTARKLLTLKSYQDIGGIAGALASHADAVLAELAAEGPNAGAVVRDLFLRLVTPDRTRAIVSMDELREATRQPDEVQRLIDHLAGARLLVVQTGGGGTGATVEIVHESLIQSWPTLRRWLDESHEDSVFLDQLRNAAKQWGAKRHDAGLLWGGEMADEAIRFLRRYRGELPQVQREFLAAVQAQATKSSRRKRAALIGATLFLTLLVIAAAVALVVIARAQKEASRQAVAARKAEKLSKDAEKLAKDSEKIAKDAEKDAKDAQVQAEQNLEQVKRETAARLVAEQQVKEDADKLKSKNDELLEAVKKAEKARRHAKTEATRANKNATLALQAQAEADAAAKEAQRLYEAEKERLEAVKRQLHGATAMDTLP